MSLLAIRRALETALAAMSPALATAYEGDDYTPTAGTPYQRVNFKFADPGNTEIGPNFTQEGWMMVMLRYPKADATNSSGLAAVTTRAEAIRAAFYRKRTLSNGGVNVTIWRTPKIGDAVEAADRLEIPVSVRFFASITA